MSLAVVGLRATSLLARQFDLIITSLILDATNLVAVILLFIIYHSELRHALTRLDVLAWFLPHRKVTTEPASSRRLPAGRS